MLAPNAYAYTQAGGPENSIRESRTLALSSEKTTFSSLFRYASLSVADSSLNQSPCSEECVE